MTPRFEPFFQAIDHGLLRPASLLVPSSRRAEWRMEWESELWHARQSSAASDKPFWQTESALAAFCFGAFQDALCLRHLVPKSTRRFHHLRGSPAQVLLFLTCVLLASGLASRLLPGVRAERDFLSSQVRQGTIMIQDENAADPSAPTMFIDQVRSWQQTSQRYTDGFAFYRVAKLPVQLDAHVRTAWQIATASSNLFTLAGWSLQSAAPVPTNPGSVPQLVLSDRLWRRQFKADQAIVGAFLVIDSRPSRVIGIAPDEASRLPGHSDAWLLEPNSQISSAGRGYVIAHLTPSGRSEMWGGSVHISSVDSHRSERGFWGSSLEEQPPVPSNIYWFGMLLAFLALPSLASVSLTEYCFTAHKPSWTHRIARFAFFAAKMALIMLIADFLSVDLAYWHFSPTSPSGIYIQLIASFAICLMGMHWALLDQRHRCPVCLKCVTHPALVGSASRMFLAWSGTELMCADGHTLLHVPGLPTSWFGAERWMFLDPSWHFLFAG